MIDINELRRLAQAATPGPWKTGQYLGSLRQFVIHTDVGDKGRGSDVAFTSAAFGNDETVANARLIAAANPAAINELLDRLEAAEKDIALKERIIDSLGAELNAVAKERDALRAKVEQLTEAEAVMRRNAFEYQAEAERLRAENAGVVDENIKLRAMIQVALVVLDEVCGNINPERGYADELETDVKRAIAAIAIPGAKGE